MKQLKQKTLDNGLCVIGELNESAKSAAVGFFVKTGGRDEDLAINGVSHFLEHMLFKGTDKLDALSVNAAFDRTGAKFNAGTSEEMTMYYSAILPEYLEEIAGLWMELMRPALRDEDFNIEKNVIKEEIAMYKDLPEFDIVDKCRSLYFADHPCGYSVLGSEECIDKMTAEQMRGYFNSRYVPNNMVLALTGNFEWDKILQLASDKCGRWEKMAAGRTTQGYAGNCKTESEAKSELSREHMCLMSKGVSAQDDKRFAGRILASIIGDSVGSRYFWSLIDNAVAETAMMGHYDMDGVGMFCSYFRCSPENFEKVNETVDSILRKIASGNITAHELTKAKNKILSAKVIHSETPMGRLEYVGMNWLYLEKYRTLQDDINAIKSVTLDDVNALAAELKPAEYTKFSIGPEGQ